MAEGQLVDEIASLLDQCSPDELANILDALDNGGLAEQLLDEDAQARAPASLTAPLPGASGQEAGSPPQVLPPSLPPPESKRPVPAGAFKPAGAGDQDQIALTDAKKLLEDHSSAVVSEVRRMAPYMGMSSNGGGGEGLDLETLTKVLAARDDEVKELEGRLSEMQAELSAKDRRVADLGGELDLAIREVRHRQLDLEFQQLKLDETVRNNTEMEQAAKTLAARVDEASLNARHAALDIDMGRNMPGLMRAQGTLPWTVRKKRPGSSGLI